METLQSQIQKIMAEKDMSAYMLSKATGIDQGHLSAFFAGKKELSMKRLSSLLDALDCEIKISKK